MRFETTPQWDRDWKGLKPEHQRQFREVLPDFVRACDAYAASKDEVKRTAPPYRWAAALRVHPMKSAPGIWELTWSFASPDGRATFQFVSDEKGMLLRWRRIGDHSIYRTP